MATKPRTILIAGGSKPNFLPIQSKPDPSLVWKAFAKQLEMTKIDHVEIGGGA
jgi:hypothetical protein